MRSTNLCLRALGISKLLQQRVAASSSVAQSAHFNVGALLESPEVTRLIEASSAPQRLDGTNISATSAAAVLGQLMASVASPNFTVTASRQISNWIAEALKLEKLTGQQGGVVTCPSSADAMVLAIGSLLQRTTATPSKVCVYVGENAIPRGMHAASRLGIPTANIKIISTASAGGMDLQRLQRVIEADTAAGLTPLAVIANISTRHDGMCDSAQDVTSICRQLKLASVIDAGFTAFAASCPQYRPLFDGWENADAIVFEAGSWLPCGSSTGFVALRDVSGLHSDKAVDSAIMRIYSAFQTIGVRGIQDRVNLSGSLSAELKKALRAERIAVVNVPDVPGTVTVPMNFEEDAREVAEECRVRSGLHVAARGRYIRIVLPATIRMADIPAVARVIAASASEATRQYQLVQLTPEDLGDWNSLPESVDALIKSIAQPDAVTVPTTATSSTPLSGSSLLDVVSEFRQRLKTSA